ncbi:MAG TPA: DUF4149 domain-containing protein [Oculatellaceae cyanobacterium]|jgi:hypothetical protein
MFCTKNVSCGSVCFSLGTGLQMLGLALITGGLLALGAITAPILFGQLPRDNAASVMAIIFRRYDMVLLIATGLTLLGEALRVGSRQMVWHPIVAAVRGFLLLALCGMLLYSTTITNPQIEAMNKAGIHRNLTTAEGRRFDRTHRLSETLAKLSLASAVLLILLTPFAGKPSRLGEDRA